MENSIFYVPLILFDRVCLTEQFSSVVADGVQSAQMATQHFLDNGSKRVAFIGGANHLDIVKKRKHGYLEALRDNRIPIEKELVVCRITGTKDGFPISSLAGRSCTGNRTSRSCWLVKRK